MTTTSRSGTSLPHKLTESNSKIVFESPYQEGKEEEAGGPQQCKYRKTEGHDKKDLR